MAMDSSEAVRGFKALRTLDETWFTASWGAQTSAVAAPDAWFRFLVISPASSRMVSTRMISRFTASTERFTRSMSGSSFSTAGMSASAALSTFSSVGLSCSCMVFTAERVLRMVSAASITSQMATIASRTSAMGRAYSRMVSRVMTASWV